MSGTTVSRNLDALLIQLAVEGGAGMIACERGKHLRLFCLERSQLVYATSNVIEEQLDRALVEHKVLDGPTAASAAKQAAEAQVKLGAFLRSQGFPPDDVLSTVLEKHARKLLEETFDWKNGKYRYTPGKADLGEEPRCQIPLSQIVFDRCQVRPKELAEVRSKLGSATTRPMVQREAASRIRFSSPALTYLLQVCNGERTLQSIVDESPVELEITLRTMLALSQLKIVLPAESTQQSAVGTKPLTRDECKARFAQAESSNHYLVLGLGSQAKTDDIRDAYYTLARRFHPDRFRTGPLADLLPEIEVYFSQVTEAYNTLNDAVAREAYDEKLAGSRSAEDEPRKDAAYLARENFAKAKILIEQRRLQDAVQFLENAIDLDARPTYLIALGKILIRNPRQRAEAQEHLTKAIALDPTIAEAHVAMAELHLKQGRQAEAAAAIEEALNWDPHDANAQQLAAEIGGTGKKEKEGLLKGLFRG